jgi:hypothetical protein
MISITIISLLSVIDQVLEVEVEVLEVLEVPGGSPDVGRTRAFLTSTGHHKESQQNWRDII